MAKENNKIKAGDTKSLWIETTPKTDFPVFKNGKDIFDVVVVGAGIAGLSTAYFLSKEGKKVLVLEMNKIVEGVTGFTTAKVTALHGLKYKKLVKYFGEEKAGVYAEANQEAIEMIAKIVEEEGIDCDFTRTTAYTYTEEARSIKGIEKEVKAGLDAGLETFFSEDAELPFEIEGAVGLKNQALFHPRKYLLALTKIIQENGGLIFENTRVLDVEEETDKSIVTTDRGKVEGKDVVLATNFPIKDTGKFYARFYPYYSYAMALTIKEPVPKGAYLTNDHGHHSLRPYTEKGKDYLIAGGSNHKSGQGGDNVAHFNHVLDYAKSKFTVESVKYHWSTMDYKTLDGAPFIGLAPKMNHLYIATGFGAWGMTNGTVSGMLITDLIFGRANKHWVDFFDPRREDPKGTIFDFGKESLNVGTQYAKGYFLKEKTKPEDLEKGEGKVFKENGAQKAYYKDDKGKIHSYSAHCTHMGCVVNWNNAEQTWDCPCHGSRFSKEGKVIHGPALKDLE